MRARAILLLLLVAVVGAGACGGWPAHAAASRPKAAVSRAAVSPAAGGQTVRATVDTRWLRVLFVGASVTDGWFASTKDHSYPALVAKGLGEHDRVRVQILARPGITAQEVAAWDLSVPSDVVIVQIATNDFARDVPVAAYSAAYAELLDRLRIASPNAELICLGAWHDPADTNRLGATAAEYDAATRTQCAADRGRYVDLSSTYLDPANHGPAGRPTYQGPGDLFHPNDRGHAALASLILGEDAIPESQQLLP